MQVFLDTNVFIASLTDEPGRGEVATKLMNSDIDFCTSDLNLMELRTVLTKKKRVKKPETERIIDDIQDRVKVTPVDTEVMNRALDIQKEFLLYPMDAIVTASAALIGFPLATFDSELIENGAEAPEDLIKTLKFE
ncbi:type II toxin-antitoxin system VapC family toxin [Halobium palmae]|uniref:Type II toxin-antitoxin system VapC family toxin n=1 Tax=Halobium palmae TaxID=1776492 RepID=A0ABD5RV92_9EURY